jgi:hypothetical protein
MKFDVPKIKSEIRILAYAIREHKENSKEAQRQQKPTWGLQPSTETAAELESTFDAVLLSIFRPRDLWLYWRLEPYFTRLCALRASMRHRLHFSPRTKGSTAQYYGIKFPVTLGQEEWAFEIADRYQVEQIDTDDLAILVEKEDR